MRKKKYAQRLYPKARSLIETKRKIKKVKINIVKFYHLEAFLSTNYILNKYLFWDLQVPLIKKMLYSYFSMNRARTVLISSMDIVNVINIVYYFNIYDALFYNTIFVFYFKCETCWSIFNIRWIIKEFFII